MRLSQIIKRGMHAGVQHLPPPERPRECLDHARCRPAAVHPRRTVRGHHKRPPRFLNVNRTGSSGRLPLALDRRVVGEETPLEQSRRNVRLGHIPGREVAGDCGALAADFLPFFQMNSKSAMQLLDSVSPRFESPFLRQPPPQFVSDRRQRAKAPEQRQVFGRLPIRAAWSAPPSGHSRPYRRLSLRRADARLSFGDNREFSLFWPKNREAGAEPSRRAGIYLAKIRWLGPSKATFLLFDGTGRRLCRTGRHYARNRELDCAEQGAGFCRPSPAEAAIRPASPRRRPGPARSRAAAAAARAAA